MCKLSMWQSHGLLCLLCCTLACNSEEPAGAQNSARSAGGDQTPASASVSGSFQALTYNVAGLPEGLSQSMPERNTPLIGPLLNAYDLVLLQESWQTPDPNPSAPTRVYHEILVAASDLPYKSIPAPQPLGMDPDRPSALLSDGLNMFSRFEFDAVTRVRWDTCVDTASDCLAIKGFSATHMQLGPGAPVDVYDLHMEAGDSVEDDAARDRDIDQLLTFMANFSAGAAVIVGGDFNLHTDHEPASSQFQRLLTAAELRDACSTVACNRPGSIDKFLFRDSDRIKLSVDAWSSPTERFVTSEGEPLSDHDPVLVRFAWAASAE
jgi:hypothetical protein